MKILIMGASCAGSTTLGKTLAERLKMPYLDTDAYFWEPSEIAYTIKRPHEIRVQMLKEDLRNAESCIVGGSLISWGEEWKTMFDLVVFLYLPKEIRLARLIDREYERYGTELDTNPQRAALFKDFIIWAAQYDDPDFSGRSIKFHEDWLKCVSGKVLEIRGDTTVEERVRLVEEAIGGLKRLSN